jgi:hypothetical protein
MIAPSAMAQEEYGTGVLWDSTVYTNATTDQRGPQNVMPKILSLKNYCPVPSHQGKYQTCVGWAIGYAACTIMEAIYNHCTDSDGIKEIAISPAYVYAKAIEPLSGRKDNCNTKVRLKATLDKLKREPLPRHHDLHFKSCDDFQPPKDATNQLRIENFQQLSFDAIKGALADSLPVIVSVKVCQAFKDHPYLADRWRHTTSDDRHALCIIGYDDSTSEFELINSWGTDWGTRGFITMKYDVLKDIFDKAYSLQTNRNLPHRRGANTYESAQFKSQIALKQLNDVLMPLESTTSMLYTTQKNYQAKDTFRIEVTETNKPIFLYILNADNLSDGLSNDKEFSTYNSIHSTYWCSPYRLTIPVEKGTDYFILLYSDEALPIEELKIACQSLRGTAIIQRIEHFFKDRLQRSPSPKGLRNEISFQAPSMAGKVAVLSIAVKHE